MTQAFEFKYSALEAVVCGESAASAVARLAKALGARQVLLLASRSLSDATDEFRELRQSLGSRYGGSCTGIGSHTPRGDVMVALKQARKIQADLLVSLGGGSIIDAAKVVQLAIDQNIRDERELLQYAQQADGSRGERAGDLSYFSGPSKIRQLAVPTTLSGAEFSNNAGVLDTVRNAKEGYRGIDLCPQYVVYDPELCLHTPQWLWLSTAIRSLDHAVEGFCSAACNAFLDGHFLHAMSLFAQSLPAVHANPQDLQARQLNQQAVWLACCGLGTVPHGASHGIGYTLGSLCGVPHGHTSCVMLPAVLQWNAEINGERQNQITRALGGGDSAAEAVRRLVAGLGLPTTLQQVGVEQSQLSQIAERAYLHPVLRNNPRPISGPKQLLEILQLAWGQ